MPPSAATLPQRIAVFLFLSIALGTQTYFSWALVQQTLYPERVSEGVITVKERAPVLDVVDTQHYPGINLKPGDRLLSANGVAYQSRRSLGVVDTGLKPGDRLTLVVERDGKQLPPVTIELKAIAPLSLRQQFLNFLFGGALPWFAVLLGVTVLVLKPWDRLAWFFACLVISFCYMLSNATFWGLPRYLGIVFTVFLMAARFSWTLWLFLFGLYFPDRHPLDRRLPWLKWILLVPLTVQTLVIIVQRVAADESWQAAAWLARLDALVDEKTFLTGCLAVFGFFMLLGYRRGTEKNPDAKRRLRLLNWGAMVTFTPLFFFFLYVVVLTRFFTQGGSFSTDQPFVALTLCLTVPVFPLVLGYLVVVHRALDIRVVLRQGLQYALATRGLVVLQVLVTVAVIPAAVFATGEASTPQRITAIATAIAFVLGVRRGAEWLRVWIDRHFFRDAYQAEHILTELSDTVRTMVETHPLLETVSRRIAETLHVPRIAVLLEAGGGFAPAYALGYEAPPPVSFERSSVTVRELERAAAPLRVYFDDPTSWVNRSTGPGEAERRLLSALDAQLLLPLSIKDRILGFLCLGPKRSEEPYSGSDLRLLSSVAGQTGLALENSRLAATIAQETASRERINRELEIARDVQRRFFPQRKPAVAGLDYAGLCRPAQSVGGDFYDFRLLESGQLAVAIGDVAGKGAPAALLMASLQASLRAQAASGLTTDLATRIEKLNALISEITPASRFSTLFCAQYDPVTRVLEYVNAGHNPPLLVRRGEASALAMGGPAIGLSRTARYPLRTLTLEEGDVLALFTDGVSEAMNPAREEFGEQRLAEVLGRCMDREAGDSLNEVLTAVDAFAAGAAQHDDITLVLLRVTG